MKYLIDKISGELIATDGTEKMVGLFLVKPGLTLPKDLSGKCPLYLKVKDGVVEIDDNVKADIFEWLNDGNDVVLRALDIMG